MQHADADFIFTFHRSQRDRFRDGSLARHWKVRYPEIFDDDDLRILETKHQRRYHFFEWLSAILLYEATGYLSLVEGYMAKAQASKRSKTQQILRLGIFEWLDEHQSGQPDLFVYRPNTDDWFFCEVKGGPDRVRENQKLWMAGFKDLLTREGIPSYGRTRVIQLVEVGP